MGGALGVLCRLKKGFAVSLLDGLGVSKLPGAWGLAGELNDFPRLINPFQSVGETGDVAIPSVDGEVARVIRLNGL